MRIVSPLMPSRRVSSVSKGIVWIDRSRGMKREGQEESGFGWVVLVEENEEEERDWINQSCREMQWAATGCAGYVECKISIHRSGI